MACDGSMGVKIMRDCIRMQCASAFLPTDGIHDYAHVNESINLLQRNIRHLIGDRSVNAVAQAAGVPQPWLHRLEAGKTKSVRDMDSLGKLARHLGVTASDLMFKDLTEVKPPSHLTGPEQATVDAAVKLVRHYDAMMPPNMVKEDDYAHRLYVAMLVVEAEGAARVLDNDSFPDVARSFAARLRAVG